MRDLIAAMGRPAPAPNAIAAVLQQLPPNKQREVTSNPNIMNSIGALLESGKAVGEVAAVLVSGAVAEPVSGITGLLTGDVNAIPGMQQRMTYKPSETGQKALGRIGSGITKAAEATGLNHLPGYWKDRVVPAMQQVGGDKAGAGAGAAMLGAMAIGAPRGTGKIGNFDPRYTPRTNKAGDITPKEAERLSQLQVDVEPRNMRPVDDLSLTDLEGKAFITSMSDRTAAGGEISGINGVKLDQPVNLQGGQDYMNDNQIGAVWASAPNAVTPIMRMAEEAKKATGQNPLYIPWRMAPTGGDFATMTGETMIAFAGSNMTKKVANKADKEIKALIPEWKGVKSPESIDQFRGASADTRKKVQSLLDVKFRDSGGLSISEARLAVSDPRQVDGRDSGIMNVGEVYAGRPMITQSDHAAYPSAIPGQGIGRIKEDFSIFDLMPDVVANRGMPAGAPRATDIRALQMKPYSGIIDEELLKRLGY